MPDHHILENADPFAAEVRSVGWRDVVSQVVSSSGLLSLSERLTASALRRANEYRCTILYYHRIGTGGVPVYNGIPAHVFEQQIKYLKSHYRVISLAQFLEDIQSGSSAEPSVVITFDDGYVGTYTEALPILKRYAVPATLYVTVGCIESGDIAWYDKIFLAFQLRPESELRTNVQGEPLVFQLGSKQQRLRAALDLILRLRTLSNEERVLYCRDFDVRHALPESAVRSRMLNWEQVRALHGQGVSIGCHTMTHPVVSSLTAAEAEYELAESKELAEKRIGERLHDFAFPFGGLNACSRSTIDLIAQLGYRSAVSTVEGVNSKDADPLFLRRSCVIEDRQPAFSMLKINELFCRGATSRLVRPPDASFPNTCQVVGERHA